MYAKSNIVTKTGAKRYSAWYVDAVNAEINQAREQGRMAIIESDAIPTGQHFYLDPDSVESINPEH